MTEVVNHDSINLHALEFEYEVVPRSPDVISNQKVRFYSYGQLYVYLNLEFLRRIVEFSARVLAKMTSSYKTIVDQCPPVVRNEINKGSFYQRVIEKMIENKKKQFENNILKYQTG